MNLFKHIEIENQRYRIYPIPLSQGSFSLEFCIFSFIMDRRYYLPNEKNEETDNYGAND